MSIKTEFLRWWKTSFPKIDLSQKTGKLIFDIAEEAWREAYDVGYENAIEDVSRNG